MAGFLPGGANAFSQVAVAVVAVIWTRADTRSRSWDVPHFVLVIVIWWAILLGHPNVPDIGSGLLGLRKSVFALVGLVLGWTWPRRSRPRAELIVVRLLIASLAVSLAVHWLAPEVEAAVVRGAGEATARFAGRDRLQGVFAGPFHVAMAASFLCLWAFARWSQHRITAAVAVLIGAVALNQAAVRTGYLAVVLGALALVLASEGARTRIKRFSALIMVGLLGLLILGVGDPDPTVASLASLSTDPRALERIPQMQDAVGLLLRSPLVGWGPGAAGDAMDDQFEGAEHVSAHNLILKLGVEGGLIGLMLTTALLIRLKRRIDWRSRGGAAALCAAMVLISFGLSGSAVEALPVSLVLMVVIGAAAR